MTAWRTRTAVRFFSRYRQPSFRPSAVFHHSSPAPLSRFTPSGTHSCWNATADTVIDISSGNRSSDRNSAVLASCATLSSSSTASTASSAAASPSPSPLPLPSTSVSASASSAPPASLRSLRSLLSESRRADAMARSGTLAYKVPNQFTRHPTRSFVRHAAAQTAFAPSGRTMRAVVPDGGGGVVLTRVPVPAPGLDELLIKVAAVGVNRADLLQIAGRYAPPPGVTPVLGLEASGYLQNGQRVCALLPGGAFAEYVVAHKSAILPLPARVADFYTMPQLAAVPEGFVAAYHVLFDVGLLAPGHAVLINAAASGVGVSAVQLAACVPDVTVIASAGSDAKLDACRKLGAHHVINYRTQSTAQAVAAATGGTGVHLAVDCVGAAQFKDIERSLRRDARWVMYGLLSGAKGEGIGLAGIVSKHLTLTGTTLRARSTAHRGRIIRDFVDRFGQHFGPNGPLSPIIHSEFNGLDAAPDAFQMLQNNENIGKLVLTIS